MVLSYILTTFYVLVCLVLLLVILLQQGKGADIAACASTPVTKAHIDTSLALGKSVNVTGTPTLFINGRSIGNVSQVPASSLKGLVDFAAKQGK